MLIVDAADRAAVERLAGIFEDVREDLLDLDPLGDHEARVAGDAADDLDLVAVRADAGPMPTLLDHRAEILAAGR